MDLFLKNKFLLRLVIVLIFLNLLSIGFIWWQRSGERKGPPSRRDKDAASLLKSKLNLSDEQENELKKIREDFFKKEESLSKQIEAQRDSMNEEMFNEKFDSIQVKLIAKRVADNEYQMELYRIEQAQQLKNLCNKDQLKKFQDLVLDIRDYLQPDKRHENKRND